MAVLRRLLAPGLALALTLAAGAAQALDLTLPEGAQKTHEEVRAFDSYRLPVGPFADGAVPTRLVKGRVTRQAWRIPGAGPGTLALMDALRKQLVAAGFDIVFACEAERCGGFDFRFNTDNLPAPEMFIDLFDYRFLAARRGQGDEAAHVSILVSRTGGAGYVQAIIVGGADAPAITTGAQRAAMPPSKGPQAPLAEQLVSRGHVVLSDLAFASGEAALAEGDYASLAALAAYLKADPRRRVALVGHTDTVGGLEPNLDLSRRRAAAVLEALATKYEVPRAQLESSGVGYLAPVAPNNTPEGRKANRRVEAVLLETE